MGISCSGTSTATWKTVKRSQLKTVGNVPKRLAKVQNLMHLAVQNAERQTRRIFAPCMVAGKAGVLPLAHAGTGKSLIAA